VTFLRLSRWDWLAFVAALALLLVMSVDWYTTKQGEECRRVERAQTQAQPGGVQGDQFGSTVRNRARECAERREKNAWQAPGLIDRVIMVVLLLAIVAAIVAAFLRAAGRRFDTPFTPSAVAAGAGLTASLLILYRILQPPGFNPAAVVKAGAAFGLALAGILAIGARSADVTARERAADGTENGGSGGEAADAPVQPFDQSTTPPDAEPPPAPG
jgi:hypothetical protein